MAVFDFKKYKQDKNDAQLNAFYKYLYDSYCGGNEDTNFLQMAHESCKRISDGVLFERIPVEEKHWYDEMGCEATTEEFYRWKIKDICTRALLYRGDPTNTDKSYALEITYGED